MKRILYPLSLVPNPEDMFSYNVAQIMVALEHDIFVLIVSVSCSYILCRIR